MSNQAPASFSNPTTDETVSPVGAPPEGELVEQREYRLEIAPDSDIFQSFTLVDASESVRLPVAIMPDLVARTKEGNLVARSSIVTHVAFCLARDEETPSNRFLTRKTLIEDAQGERVAPLNPLFIIDGGRNTDAVLDGIAANPELANEEVARLGEGVSRIKALAGRAAVLGNAQAFLPDGNRDSLFTLVGGGSRVVDELRLAGLTLNTARDGVDVIALTPQNIQSIRADELTLLGTVAVERDGTLIFSGRGVYTDGLDQRRLPCLTITSMERPEYPYKVPPDEVHEVRRVLDPNFGALADLTGDEPAESTYAMKTAGSPMASWLIPDHDDGGLDFVVREDGTGSIFGRLKGKHAR